MSGVHEREPGQEEQQRAMRIMEALSGVDEELLERCSARRKVRPLWRNARAFAAVLCLAVVGAAAWGGYQLSNLRMGSSDRTGGNGAWEAEAEWEASPSEDPASGNTAPEEQETVVSSEERNGDGKDQSWSDGLSDPEAGEGDTEGKTQDTDGADHSGSTGMGGVEEGETVTDQESCLQLQAEKLTEEQSRNREALGVYVPEALPEGYVFESAYTVPEESQANLTVYWRKGMDSIMLYLEKPRKLPATVDVARREYYDESLYDIPYGETVPEDYREIFEDPVFAAEDLTLEVVRSRMRSYDDLGDTDTPRGRFCVLYPDGVLARFNGRGTAEEIWEMFCSMGENE